MNSSTPARPRPHSSSAQSCPLMRQLVADTMMTSKRLFYSCKFRVKRSLCFNPSFQFPCGHVHVEMTNALATFEDDSVTYHEYYGEYDQDAAEGDVQGYDGLDDGLEDLSFRLRFDGGFICSGCGYCN